MISPPFTSNSCGIADDRLLDVCTREDRSLVTLDRGLGRAFLLSGRDNIGVAVLDIGAPQSRDTLLTRLRQLAALLETHAFLGHLWILEVRRVRMHRIA